MPSSTHLTCPLQEIMAAPGTSMEDVSCVTPVGEKDFTKLNNKKEKLCT